MLPSMCSSAPKSEPVECCYRNGARASCEEIPQDREGLLRLLENLTRDAENDASNESLKAQIEALKNFLQTN